MEKEIWKPVPKYVGIYEVSNYGNIKSLDRVVIRKNAVPQHRKGKILTPQISRDGYHLIILNNQGKHYATYVHRLVMISFHGNQNKQINHKDLNKTNNRLDNLEYCTCRDNVIHFWKDKVTTSKHNGVCFDKSRNKWIASITHNGVQHNLGRYKTEQEALEVRRTYELSIAI